MPLQIALTAFLALSGLFCSCVNQDYDLSKPIDTSINIKGDISLPIGSSEFIKIGDFLEIDESTQGIQCDDNGDYSLSFAPAEAFSANFKFDNISIGKLQQTGDVIVSIPTSGFTPSASPSGVSLFASVPTFTYSLPSDTKMNVSLDQAFEEESIVDIKEMATDAPASLRFNISTGAVQLCAGMQIVFPQYLTVSKQNTSDSRFSISGNTLRIDSPIKVSKGSSSSIDINVTGIDFSKMPAGMGLVTVGGKRKIVINDNVSVSGDVKINPADFTSIPAEGSFRLTINIVMNDIAVKSATAKVNASYNIDNQKFELGEMPEFLSGGNISLDIWNPVIGFTIDNRTPFKASIAASLKAYAKAQATPYASLSIGGEGADKILLEKGVSRIFISRQGTHPDAQQGDKDIKKEEIADILSQIPASLGIENIAVKSSADEYVTVEMNGNYACSMEYSFHAPLAFGRNFRLEYTPEDIKGLEGSLGLGENMSLDVTSLALKFNMTNTIPVDFDLSAVPVDADGNVLAGAKVTVEGTIKSGRTDSESVSPIVLTISASNDALKKLDGIRLTVSGSSNETVEGVTLNKEQGIRLTDIKARLVGGFTTNLE
ncbi:MAG: hypothetical protein ACI4QG_07040 [Candidatus Cryptobacteroides sp.]